MKESSHDPIEVVDGEQFWSIQFENTNMAGNVSAILTAFKCF